MGSTVQCAIFIEIICLIEHGMCSSYDAYCVRLENYNYITEAMRSHRQFLLTKSVTQVMTIFLQDLVKLVTIDSKKPLDTNIKRKA